MFWHVLFIGRRRQKELPFVEGVWLIGEHTRSFPGAHEVLGGHQGDPAGALESLDVLLGLGPSWLSIKLYIDHRHAHVFHY